MLHHFMEDLSHRCSDMILKCDFEGHERNCSDIFVPMITDEGQCCSFNIMPEALMFKNDITKVSSAVVKLDRNGLRFISFSGSLYLVNNERSVQKYTYLDPSGQS